MVIVSVCKTAEVRASVVFESTAVVGKKVVAPVAFTSRLLKNGEDGIMMSH